MSGGKYRWRTALRERLPDSVAALVSKGHRDCGDHEWYLAEPETCRCYHCTVGVTHEIPWDAREFEARRLEGDAMNLRAGLASRDRAPATH
jgi:hypothetical protein